MFLIRNLFYNIRKLLFSLLRVRTLGARALVVKKDSVLFVQHTYQKGWCTVGGAVEKGESFSQAVQRELWEEIGLKTKKPPILFGTYYSFNEGRDDHIAFYIVKDFTIQEKKSSEIAQKKWFKFNELPKDITPATQRRLEEYLGKTPQSDQW